jgi:hypothetical protein
LAAPSFEVSSHHCFQSSPGQCSLGYSSALSLSGSNERQAALDYTSLTSDQQQHLKLYFKRNIRPQLRWCLWIPSAGSACNDI